MVLRAGGGRAMLTGVLSAAAHAALVLPSVHFASRAAPMVLPAPPTADVRIDVLGSSLAPGRRVDGEVVQPGSPSAARSSEDPALFVLDVTGSDETLGAADTPLSAASSTADAQPRPGAVRTTAGDPALDPSASRSPAVRALGPKGRGSKGHRPASAHRGRGVPLDAPLISQPLPDLHLGPPNAADKLLYAGDGDFPRGGTTPPSRAVPPHLGGYVFWECPWPRNEGQSSAERAEVHATADVNRDGRALAVHILDESAPGFGARAQSCALEHRFVPGRDANGQRTGGKTPPFSVRFSRPVR